MPILKPRSNRPLTKFACDACHTFLTADPEVGMYQVGQQGNTKYEIIVDPSTTFSLFTVLLYNQPILIVKRYRSGIDQQDSSNVQVGFTDFFDRYGQPSSTTAERLNGLLDCLGRHRLIPDGVRVFRDQEHHTTYIGMGDEKVAVGDRFCRGVRIFCDPTRLDMWTFPW